jgi:hypothetical protein
MGCRISEAGGYRIDVHMETEFPNGALTHFVSLEGEKQDGSFLQ